MFAKGRSGKGAGDADAARKLWGHCTNLKAPKTTVADHKLTRRQAERIALDAANAPELFERFYAGYRFDGAEVKRSEIVAGLYIYVMMHRGWKT